MSMLWNEDTLREGLYRHDEAALEEVSRRYGRILYGLAYRILGSPSDAEECVNDALLDLWNAVPPDRPKGVLAYVSALVRRRAIDRVRYKTASRRGGEDYEGSLEELAESISYSKSQTKRILLDLYGISFKEKALRTRIEAAKHYLLSTDFSVDRIALMVGYNSRNGFEQAFLKYVGVLPAELRRGR